MFEEIDINIIIGIAVGLVAILGAITIALANVLYSRPRIEAQEARIQDLTKKTETLTALLEEKEKRIAFLEDLVKGVPAFNDLSKALNNLTTALTLHESRERENSDRILVALEKMADR